VINNIEDKSMRKSFKVLVISIIFLSFLSFNSSAETISSIAYNKFKVTPNIEALDIREGDFIFQHLPARLTRVIADITNSQYSHCGIIVKKPNGFYVLEAIGPVKETPLKEWINRGVGRRITVVRLKEQYRKDIPKIIKTARQFMRAPYDIQYEMDDEKIYCSELIYKAALNGSGLRIGRLVRLGDLSWQPHEAFIRYITGGDLPLDREMITPEDIAKSEKVDTVYSSFSARESLKYMSYDVGSLAGEWSGDYTFPGNQLIQVNLIINQKGQIQQGQLAANIYIYPSNIKMFNDRTGEFKYILHDNNGTKTVIEGRIDPTKDGVFGQWNDSRGYRGVFSLSKKEDVKTEPQESFLLRNYSENHLPFQAANWEPPSILDHDKTIDIPLQDDHAANAEILNNDNFIWQPAPMGSVNIPANPKQKNKGSFGSLSTGRY
jgi:hypothetical protein